MTMSMEEEHEDEEHGAALKSWDSAPNTKEVKEWGDWMRGQLSTHLMGLTAKTSRAQVRIVTIRSATVVNRRGQPWKGGKGIIRAHGIELVLNVEGTHLKNKSVGTVSGTLWMALKTVDNKDSINLSPVQWAPQAGTSTDQELLADLSAAADSPLESALAVELNNLMWNVEQHSLDSITQ